MPQSPQSGTRTRDLLGYAGSPPDPRWPGEARVAVSIVVNFEEGAEFSVTDGDPENEAVYEIEQRLAGRSDPAIDSHFEYGSRAGWWRIIELLGQFGAPATVSSSGRAVERLPLLAQDAVRRGHEVSAHGWRWEGHADLDEAEERDRIARTVAAITAVTGIRPIGWHTRSPGSVNTRRLLVEEGGFLYDSDAYNDDLPYFVVVGDKRHLVLPYAFDTNDMQFFHTNRFSGAADFAAYVIDAFDWLHREGAHAPKMMSIGLHLRMIGRNNRARNPGIAEVEDDIAGLIDQSTHELRLAWRKLHRTGPPLGLSRDLMIRVLANKLQEHTHGGASLALRRRLQTLAGDLEKGALFFDPGTVLKTGATLVRQWRGHTHTVLVREDGFEYEGQRHRSLTVIAERITGAHWSGPRFFGVTRRAPASLLAEAGR